MLKRILFLSVALSLFLAVPLQATARTWINLPEKQGAEGDPDDGNYSPVTLPGIKVPDLIVISSLLGVYVWPQGLIKHSDVVDPKASEKTITRSLKQEATK
jgi:hypothetical protein